MAELKITEMQRKRDLYKKTLGEVNAQMDFARKLGSGGAKLKEIEGKLRSIPGDLSSIDEIISEFKVKFDDDQLFIENV